MARAESSQPGGAMRALVDSVIPSADDPRHDTVTLEYGHRVFYTVEVPHGSCIVQTHVDVEVVDGWNGHGYPVALRLSSTS